MESIKFNFSYFINKMINGIYPEQKCINYSPISNTDNNNEEEIKNNTVDNNISLLPESIKPIKPIITLETIKYKLKTHTNMIMSLTTTTDNFIILRRIYYILNILLRNYEMNRQQLEKLNSIISSLICSPPYDTEDVIIDRLHTLYDFVSYYYYDDNNITNLFSDNLSKTTLFVEIDNILSL